MTRENGQKKPKLIRSSVLLDPSDYEYVNSVLGDSGCPKSTIAQLATHLFIMMEKEEALMGQLVVTLKEHDDTSANMKRLKVGLTSKDHEIVKRISKNLECSYSQVIRYAYRLFALNLKKWENMNDKQLENYQFLINKHYEQFDKKSPRTRM